MNTFSGYIYRQKRKPNSGAMLILICVLLFVIVLIAVLLFNVWKLFVRAQDSQALIDEATLKAAVRLNSSDNIGRMNHLIAQSRELVYDSRMAYNAIITDPSGRYFYLEGLARQLLDQSRYGAWFIDQAREKLVLSQIADLKKNITLDADLESKNARIVDLEVGYAATEPGSNVYDDFADELQDFDLHNKWIDQKTKRFKGNINLKMPGEWDHNLNFKLSLLRLPLKDESQEAALINAEDFVRTAAIIEEAKPLKKVFCDQMPSAVKVKVAFPPDQVDDTKKASPYSAEVLVQSAALTSGGQPMP